MILEIDKKDREALAVKDSNGRVLSYGDICDFCDKIKKSGVSRHLCFALVKNNAGGVAWVVALLEAGIVPLVLNCHTETTLLKELITTYHPQSILYPDDFNSEILTTKESQLKAFGYSLLKTDNPDYELYPELSHLLPTSGSTGSPKLVRHKYSNIEAAALNISTFFKLSASDKALMVLPLYYTMGLSMVFSHFKAGASILITDRKMTDPAFWKFIKDEKATSFTGVPFSFEILDKMRFFRMNLPDLEILTQGGGKMPLELNKKFVDFCTLTGRKWIATYGQSEGTARMAWLPPEYAETKMGSIGIAVPNGKLSVRDSDGKEIMGSPAEGEMCYEGKNVTMGYALSQSDLAKGDERNGFLATGDLVYRDKDGFYFIKGRMGRFLKLFGNRIGLDECEHILKSKIQCDCACTGTDEKMIIYITDSKSKDTTLNSILAAIKVPANIIEIRVIPEIPKNEAGKTLYAKLDNI